MSQRFSLIGSLFEMDTSLKGKNLLHSGAEFFPIKSSPVWYHHNRTFDEPAGRGGHHSHQWAHSR